MSAAIPNRSSMASAFHTSEDSQPDIVITASRTVPAASNGF